ncbi:MAG: SHOCT domain-containing protein [Thaumarchaeota archaeon]|nr:SHOCT domain-containing protein [Nitrososphaerota archaeon]
MLSSAIIINVPGSVYDGVIEAIPKDEADKLLKIIYEKMEKGNKPAPSDDNPLSILKKRYASGEISKEEFQQIKQDLENS